MTLEMVSASQVGTFSRCPYQWYRIYPCGERLPPGVAAPTGSGVHKGAEVNHKQKVTTGVDLPVGDVLDAARDEYDRRIRRGVFLTREDQTRKAKVLGEGLDRTVRMARVYHSEIAPLIQPATVEEHLVIEPDDTDGVAIQGYIDCTTPDGTVIDLKTASKAWAAGRVEKEAQPTVYSKLYEAQHGRPPERFRFEVVVGTKTKEYRQGDKFLTTKRNEHDWAAFAARVRTMARMVKAGIFPPADPGSWICSPQHCGFFTTCPYQSRRVIAQVLAPRDEQGGNDGR